MNRDALLHFTTSSAVLLIAAQFWFMLYEAQFLEYDENYGQILAVFGLSSLMLIGAILCWFVNRSWVKRFKWQLLLYFISSGPITIAIAVFNYAEIFEAHLKH